MAEIVAQFFNVIGGDIVAPTNIEELIPYLITILISVCLVAGVFRVIGKLADIFLNITRFR